MGTIQLDGTEISSIQELHQELKSAFGFPEFYGRNLDALWDGLTEFANESIVVKWQDHSTSRSCLGTYFDEVVAIFREAETEFADFSLVLD